jgi:hypothetical protein
MAGAMLGWIGLLLAPLAFWSIFAPLFNPFIFYLSK